MLYTYICTLYMTSNPNPEIPNPNYISIINPVQGITRKCEGDSETHKHDNNIL